MSSSDNLDDRILDFRAAFASSSKICILSGAGLSAGSGIATYRDSNGLWHKLAAKEVASKKGWEDNPSRIWQFHHHLRSQYLAAKPNAAHEALASLCDPQRLFHLAPRCSLPPLLITQNIDGLSLAALHTVQPPLSANAIKIAESRVLQMHGELFRTVCLSCRHTKLDRQPALCSALAVTESAEGEVDTPIEHLPRCGGEKWKGSNRYGNCGGLLRPDVVWFGEIPKHMGEIARELAHCDMILVVGTSSIVHPAASFMETVRLNGGKVAIFNKERTPGDETVDYLFLGPCEETLPAVLGG